MKNETMYNLLRAGKIKGKTRIILEDLNGHRTIKEDHNMITNALPKIFASNYHGIMDFHNYEPLRQLVGGVFLFWDPLTESANSIYPPSQVVNKLTANAGQTPHSTDDPTRGNPNGTATVIDPSTGKIKFVWDWLLEQGNGEISAAALTHSSFGDCGLYPRGSLPLEIGNTFEINGVNRFAQSSFGINYDEQKSKRFPVKINATGTGVTIWINGASFTENIVRHPWTKPSLIEAAATNDGDNYTILSTRTATLTRTFSSGYVIVGQDDDNYYIMERDFSTATRLYCDVVSKSDFSVSGQVFDIAENLARPSVSNAVVNNGIVSGGYIYWISGTDPKTFVRINMLTPADTDILTSTMTANIDIKSTAVVLSDGLILGRNFLVNGDYIYPVQTRLTPEQVSGWTETISDYNGSPLKFTMPNAFEDYSTRYVISGGVLVPYLATVNNLSGAPVRKNSTQTMRCEYELTFTEAV